MTALKGHLLELSFEGGINRNWNDYPIEDLFRTPLIKNVSNHLIPIADNLKSEVRRADVLFIWTDGDREGEAIGGDVADLCRSVKPNITVWRARFSSMLPPAIHNAARNHIELDMKQVEAVRTRSELDLRIGAAYTRLQTMQLKGFFTMDQKKIVSYGSCQFPTLGFVVDRYLQVENFRPEQFWKITMTYQQEREQPNEVPLNTTFTWRRNHLFEHWTSFICFESCVQAKTATVTNVRSKATSKWKPLPLTTVEMQKVACRVLGLSGARIMSIAEELYTKGSISYPRTETDQFDQGFDFMSLINKQTQDSSWGEYAQLLRDGEFERPRSGKNNDKAHPPIHPTSYDSSLTGDNKRLYEFIVRRFLGCCWKNALGHETNIEVQMGDEYFDAKGLVILERHYLEVYTYDKWNGNEVPEFHVGDVFTPAQLNLEQGTTTAPKFLTESDLISLMEKNEIGTDATIAEHIQKILDRKYVFKETQYFKPLTLGIALITGYNQIDLEHSLSKPALRRQMEADLKAICEGSKSPLEVRNDSIRKYSDMFSHLKCDFRVINRSMEAHFREAEDGSNGGGSNSGGSFFNGGNRNSNRGSSGNTGRGRGRGRGETATRGRGRGGTTSRGRGAPYFPGRPNTSTNDGLAGTKLCHCNKDCVTRKVIKNNANHGRSFYSCPVVEAGCGFFEWID
ncbi:DNA topoisomerase [Thamnidium elegans]|nr:DNA topoisomerase [Thamnidium elegans]